MEISVNEALELKGQLSSEISKLESELRRSTSGRNIEILQDGSEVDVTSENRTYMEVLADLNKLQENLILLEATILEFNVNNGITYNVRKLKSIKSQIEHLENLLEMSVAHKSHPTYYTKDATNTVKTTEFRPLYVKDTIKATIKILKASQRELQAAIFTANTQIISVPFDVD